MLTVKKKKSPSSFRIPHSTTQWSWLWWVLVVMAIGMGGLLLWFFNLPYVQAHAYARSLSRSQQLASLSIENFNELKSIGRMLAGVLLVAGMGLLFFPTRTQQVMARCFNWLLIQVKRFPRDCTRFWQDFRPHRAGWFYLAAILLLMGTAILFRVLFLSQPMRHDEAYTVVVFASRPWLNLISDYHLPNNHIFHTILVKLAIELLGTAPWAVRFPAFFSGVLCIPAGYLVARQLYGRVSALLSAGLIAALPMLISYSTNARGYSQYTLFGLILFGLAIYLHKNANLVGWGLFVIVSVAGFYTVPFMLFPFGAVCFWLFVSALVGETCQAYGSLVRFFKYLFMVGIATALFTVLLYLPVVLIGTGLNSIVGNSFVASMSWADFWMALEEGFLSTWLEWNYDLPRVIQILMAAGVILSLIFHLLVSRVKIPFQITTLVWILGVLLFLRSEAWSRLWTFLMPFWLIWACGGLIAPICHFRIPWKQVELVLVILILGITVGWSIQRVHTFFPMWQSEPGQVERAAEYLYENLVAGDAIALIPPDDAPYWYYLGRLGVADEYMHQIGLKTHKRVFVVVNEKYGGTPTIVLQRHNLSLHEYQVDQAKLVYQYADQEIYLCPHR